MHTADKTVSSSLRFIAVASGRELMKSEREHEFMYRFMSGNQMRLTINRYLLEMKTGGKGVQMECFTGSSVLCLMNGE